MQLKWIPGRRRFTLLALALLLVAAAAAAGPAAAGAQTSPGAVFTETNNIPNEILVFPRNADGTLGAPTAVQTGGVGRPDANPPTAFPALDSAGPVELTSDGDNRRCLFAVNAGDDSVSSFRVTRGGAVLADREPTNGSRPASLTSTQRGPNNRVLYVLNSDFGTASIQGYYVSSACMLTQIPGSFHPTTSPDSIPAQISFNHHGSVLAVSERFAFGLGDIDLFPVDNRGVAGPPAAKPSVGITPYGLAWTNRDQLTVSNETIPTFASTVSSYQLTKDGNLAFISDAPSPGAACWNVITDNQKFLYVANAVGHSIEGFRVTPEGQLIPLSPAPEGNTTYFAIDEALSHDSAYLYALSTSLTPSPLIGSAPGASAIEEFKIDRETGLLTHLGTVVVPNGGSTSGLAGW